LRAEAFDSTPSFAFRYRIDKDASCFHPSCDVTLSSFRRQWLQKAVPSTVLRSISSSNRLTIRRSIPRGIVTSLRPDSTFSMSFSNSMRLLFFEKRSGHQGFVNAQTA
jgi:hypothetical protein